MKSAPIQQIGICYTMQKRNKTNMTISKREFLRLAKKRGVKINRGNPKQAKPLSEVIGNIKLSKKTEIDKSWYR